MKHSLKNTFPLYGKTVFSDKKKKKKKKKNRKWLPLAGKYFSVKILFPNFNHGFQQQKKGSEQKHTVSTGEEISFHQPE